MEKGLIAGNLRDALERPVCMEEAAVMMVGQSVDHEMQALAIFDSQPRGNCARCGRCGRQHDGCA